MFQLVKYELGERHPDRRLTTIGDLVVANDPLQGRGAGTIGTLLSDQGMPLPRDFIRDVLSNYAPEGLHQRFPGANTLRRSNLSALGPNHQHHADGHDKLNAWQGLDMGGAGCTRLGYLRDQGPMVLVCSSARCCPKQSTRYYSWAQPP